MGKEYIYGEFIWISHAWFFRCSYRGAYQADRIRALHKESNSKKSGDDSWRDTIYFFSGNWYHW